MPCEHIFRIDNVRFFKVEYLETNKQQYELCSQTPILITCKIRSKPWSYLGKGRRSLSYWLLTMEKSIYLNKSRAFRDKQFRIGLCWSEMMDRMIIRRILSRTLQLGTPAYVSSMMNARGGERLRTSTR